MIGRDSMHQAVDQMRISVRLLILSWITDTAKKFVPKSVQDRLQRKYWYAHLPPSERAKLRVGWTKADFVKHAYRWLD